MVSRISIFRNPLKRKKGDTIKNDAPAKKARVVEMKQLASTITIKITLLSLVHSMNKINLFILG